MAALAIGMPILNTNPALNTTLLLNSAADRRERFISFP
ncbi:hypothetical protein Q7O_002600 [Pectobacterium carotovorum subsp. carotovorum PCCS1]|nr:hypothetical protein [Pectobacterium carotovorum subsp. carotovorum PCCS1]